LPPGAKGMTQRIGFDGKACARTVAGKTGAANAPAPARINPRRTRLIVPSSRF
jgi:hypothetical protein